MARESMRSPEAEAGTSATRCPLERRWSLYSKQSSSVAFRSSSVIPSNFPGSRYPKQMYFIHSSLFPVTLVSKRGFKNASRYRRRRARVNDRVVMGVHSRRGAQRELIPRLRYARSKRTNNIEDRGAQPPPG